MLFPVMLPKISMAEQRQSLMGIIHQTHPRGLDKVSWVCYDKNIG